MASLLKRKGGPVEVVNSPKRAKAAKNKKASNGDSSGIGSVLESHAGWEQAFNPSKVALVESNGVNGEVLHVNESSSVHSAEGEEYEDFLRQGKTGGIVRKARALRGTWKCSEPIGGRIISVDPVFSQDEKFLIVANRTSVKVYSTTDSLLIRNIDLKADPKERPNAGIVAYCLSPTNHNMIWIALSDGFVYNVDWTTGAGVDGNWQISTTGCVHMTVASMESAGRRKDVVFTIEPRTESGWRITANELGVATSAGRTIYTSAQRIDSLKTAAEGSVIVASSENRLLLGNLRSTEYNDVGKIKYEFRIFESTDYISSLDVRTTPRRQPIEGKKSRGLTSVVDVVVGDVKGNIFIHNDLLANLIRSQSGSNPGVSLVPRKLHWHRQMVHTVKWSLDGNYIISGGTETVLVLWQLDTGKRQFLPHMSATIQSAVVSPTGSSYAIHLADNSTMVLSTSELSPTANVAGIQACSLNLIRPKDSHVPRIKEDSLSKPLIQRTPAVINPSSPHQILLGVGQSQEIDARDPAIMSVPFLQTFNLGSNHNINRQALTRTNVTNINVTPTAHKISEPRVTHIQISYDGKWLATVDEWTPPKHDLEFLAYQGEGVEEERKKRREAYLKFWQWNAEADKWELVSRIDSPHDNADGLGGAGQILDLVADPVSLRFATIGEDSVVRTWYTKSRKRDGVVVTGKDGKPFRNWHCQHAISLGRAELEGVSAYSRGQASPLTGAVAFSEDGSLLIGACGGDNDGLVHFIDPTAGTNLFSRTGLYCGDILKAGILGKSLITLSDTVCLYDVVSEQIRYRVKLSDWDISLSTEQKREMMHLATDNKSQTFAVSVPAKISVEIPSMEAPILLYTGSEVAVFQLDDAEPVHVEKISTVVTALLPATGSEGFLMLDSTAEIRTISKKGSQTVLDLAKSTSDLQLDEVTEEQPTGDLLRLMEDDQDMEEVSTGPVPSGIPAFEDDNETPVVTTHQLSAIFDVGPAFALPPLEEMFYQLADMYASKPRPQAQPVV